MKRIGILLSALITVLGLSVSVDAKLVDMGDGTIYDTATQLSWLKNANTAGTEMTWSQAVAWAASLNTGSGFAGLTGWRLPATTQPDPTCSQQLNPGGSFPLQGYADTCTGCEMGYLYYVSLGNVANSLTINTGPFTNVQATEYWSGTLYAPNTSYAWAFGFGPLGSTNGYQTAQLTASTYYSAWAVSPGARTLPASVGYSPQWLIVTLVSLTLFGGLLLRRRMARA